MSSAVSFFIGLIAVFQIGDCAITVTTPAATTHTISPSVVEGANAAASTIYTIVATTDGMTSASPAAPAAITYSIVAGGRYFENAAAVVKNTAVLDYETRSVYTIKVKLLDDAAAPASVTLTFTLTVTDAATDPYFSSVSYCARIDDLKVSGSTIKTIRASDPNSDTLTYSILAGSNTNTDFAISSAGVITTANALNRQTTATYDLVIYAADATLSGTTTLNVCVGTTSQCPSCSGAAAMAASILLTVFALLLVR